MAVNDLTVSIINMWSKSDSTEPGNKNKGNIASRHPVVTNVVIVALVALLGLCIAYLSLTLFTKHGQKKEVPGVVGTGYSEAVDKLHDAGFKIEIRDSLYLDNVKPGLVVEQYPRAGSMVKPGRKIFLYINAVYPKQVVIDPSSANPGGLALAGYGLRQADAMLEECGFKNIRIVYIHGDTDRVVRVLANGKAVRAMEKVPVNASIVLEVYDNSMQAVKDSMQENAYYEQRREEIEQDMLENPEKYREAEESPAMPEPEESEPEFIEY